MAFRIFDKSGAQHRFDSRDACENFLLAQGYSPIDAKHYANSALDDGGTRLDSSSRQDARENMIKRESALKPLGQQYFQKGDK